jgi:glycosyltransferase involved in cell wall biosynthesis
MIQSPYYSIVIPTFNRPDCLRICLHAIAHLNYPKEQFEVIVVDDGSPHPLDAVVESFNTSFAIKLLRQSNKGPAAARNTGIAAARGIMIAFVDDDCEPDENWLQVLAAQHATALDCLIGGRMINRLSNNLYSTASQLITDVVYRHYNADPNNARFVASNNMALPTDSLREIGGFDEAFLMAAAEDRELCERWRSLGKRIVYSPDMIVYHSHHLTLTSYLRQHFNYGRGAYHFHQKRFRRGVRSLSAEASFHHNIANWLFYPLTRVSGWRKPALFSLIVLWQIANAAGYFFQLWRSQKPLQHPATAIPDQSA